MEEIDVKQAKEHGLWEYFVEWCETDMDGSVDPDDHPEDWFQWWECFVSGAIAHIRKESGDSGQLGKKTVLVFEGEEHELK